MSTENILKLADKAANELANLHDLLKEQTKQLEEMTGCKIPEDFQSKQ